MSSNKDLVQTYMDGFRRSDHAQILSCLTDDIVWELPGYTTLSGKEAFDREIENDAFEGSPTLTVDRLIEEDDAVVAVGAGQARKKGGGVLRFVFCDVFTFTAGKVRVQVGGYAVRGRRAGVGSPRWAAVQTSVR